MKSLCLTTYQVHQLEQTGTLTVVHNMKWSNRADAHEQPHNVCQDGAGTWIAWFGMEKSAEAMQRETLRHYPKGGGFPSPLGMPGVQVAVREEYSLNHSIHAAHVSAAGTSGILYRAKWPGERDYYDRPFEADRRWRSAYQMPARLARLLPVLTNAQPQRDAMGVWQWHYTLAL